MKLEMLQKVSVKKHDENTKILKNKFLFQCSLIQITFQLLYQTSTTN